MFNRRNLRSHRPGAAWFVSFALVLLLGTGCGDDDDGGGTGPAGDPPVIDGITDTTGGTTVVGDVLRVTGQRLDGANVTVGGVAATILESTATELRVQIPSGVPAGTVVVRASASGQSASLSIDVSRYAVFVTGRGGGALDVYDTSDFSLVETVSVPVGLSNYPKVVDFLANGALAIVPLGSDSVAWIDLTATPIASGVVPIAGAVQTLGVGISPDGLRAAIADRSGQQVHSLSIDESTPPFTTPLSVGTSTPLAGLPRAPRFIDDDNLLIMLESEDAIARMERAPLQFTDSTERFDEGLCDYPLETVVSARGDLFVLGYSLTSLRRYTVSGPALAFADSVTTASNGIGIGIDPTGETVFVALESEQSIVSYDVSAGAAVAIDSVAVSSSDDILTSMGVDPTGAWLIWTNLAEGGVADIGPEGAITPRATNPFASPGDLGSAFYVGIQP